MTVFAYISGFERACARYLWSGKKDLAFDAKTRLVIALHAHEKTCTQFCKLLTTSICNYIKLLVNISSINIEDHLFVKPVHLVQQEQVIIHRIR